MGRDYKIVNNRLKQIIALLSCGILFLNGCIQYNNKYGIESNEMRKDIGLPLLPKNWTAREIFGVPNTTWTWSNPKKDSTPYYSEKTVSFDKNMIIYERNKYLGSSYIKTIDGNLRESLSITYNFVDKENGRNVWKYVLLTSDNEFSDLGYETFQSIELSKHQADSVLNSWNLAQNY